MKNEPCYKTFEYIYNEHIRRRVTLMTANSSSKVDSADVNQRLDRLRKAVRTMRTLDDICSDTEDVYRTFTRERLEEMIADIANGVNLAKNLTSTTGFLEAIDKYFDVMVDCFKVQYLPESELELLRSFGSHDPEQELTAINQILKTRVRNDFYPPWHERRHGWFDSYGGNAEEVLNRAEEKVSSNSSDSKAPEHKPKRWFKICGQIGGGAGVMAWNVLAVVHDPNQTVSSVTSVLGGFQAVLQGLGDLREE